MTRLSKYPEQHATSNYVITNEERDLWNGPLSVTILANLSLRGFFPAELSVGEVGVGEGF